MSWKPFKAPSLATAISVLALVIAMGGTAVAVAPTVVNIADPTTPANKAHVDAAGKIAVGDGAGGLTVDGTVTSQLAVPNTVIHTHSYGFPSSSCAQLAAPPAGKALIIDQVRVNTYDVPSPGNGQVVVLYTGNPGCSTIVGDVNPPTVGQAVITFGAGLGIPQGRTLSMQIIGNVSAEIFVDAHTVAASAVPAVSASAGEEAPESTHQNR